MTAVVDPLLTVLADIATERRRQDADWGQQNHPDGTGDPYWTDMARHARFVCHANANAGTVKWLHILREEVYEAFAENDPAKLRAELVQVAAVAAAWIEAIDRRSNRAASGSWRRAQAPAVEGAVSVIDPAVTVPVVRPVDLHFGLRPAGDDRVRLADLDLQQDG